MCKKILEKEPEAFVYLGSRDAGRGEKAVADIKSELGAGAEERIVCLPLDVTSDESVAAAAAAVEAPLYGIVNNAGVGFGLPIADTLAVNLFGSRRVSEAFIPLLDQAAGRVVNIASASGPMFVAGCGSGNKLATQLSDLDAMPSSFEELEAAVNEAYPPGCPDYDGASYGLSKACLTAYTVQLARRFPALRVNAVTPGFIDTDITKGMGARNPPEKGTIAPYFCLFEDVPFDPENGVNGRYYGSDSVRSPLDRYRGPGDPPYDP